MNALCRDCGARGEAAGGADERCRECRGPRVVRHDELGSLAIAHLDCDAFYAAVEKRDNPELLDKPVIVGGGRRGVVSTACYIARLHGVGSAMPMFKALAACPDAVVLRPDMARYRAAGAEVRAAMREACARVQPVSIDEAYLDFEADGEAGSGAAGSSAAERLAALARRIERDFGITVSIGLSHNKLLAKLASDLDKPRGFSVVGRAETRRFLAPLPVRKLPGVGPALAARLRQDGIATVGQLQGRGADELARRYGSFGRQLARYAVGEDDRKVEARGQTRSVSAETTFETDTADPAALEEVLRRLCARVAERLERHDLSGQTVVLKLKSHDFRLRTRSTTLASATRRAEVIAAAGLHLLLREANGTRYRLLGIGVAKLGGAGEADPPDMLAAAPDREAGREQRFPLG